MRDGIAVARAGKPAVAIVTTKFEEQGDFVAAAEGMPAVPRLVVPHPVAGIGGEAMATLAKDISDALVARLEQG